VLFPQGSDLSAKELVNPPKFSFDGIDQSDFIRPRPIEELQSLFSGSGYPCSDRDLKSIVETINSWVQIGFVPSDYLNELDCRQFGGESTIMSFQAAYNIIHPFSTE
jgi:hypothetical protein